MDVHVLALRDCTPMMPAGFVDVLRKTAAMSGHHDVKVALVSATRERTISTAGGVRLGCDATLKEIRRSDLVLVPALDADVLVHLELNREVVSWLRRMHFGGAQIASACTGAFLIAEAGLLDGESATTHWAFQPLFAQRYPKVHLEPQAVIVDQGQVITSGGATSFLTLSLYLAERLLGPEAARNAARLFLVDVNKPPQSAYAVFAAPEAHGDEDVFKAQQLIADRLANPPSVDALARAVSMSRRNFVRRFTRATGSAPRDYVQLARIETAKRALEQDARSVPQISTAVGYEDIVAFRKLFQRRTGLTPSEYRLRFGSRALPTLVVRHSVRRPRA
jgi:transcriptional regulator GlxA family with amidase domain